MRLTDLYDCSAKIHSVMRGDMVKVITREKLNEVVHEYQVLVTWFRHDLNVAGGAICYKNRAVIPAALRPQVLETIHTAHQGISGMISKIQKTVFWPGICADVIKTRGSFLTCVKNAPSQPAGSPVALPVTSFPFQYEMGD